jgi:lipopolysaccharide export system permease protein
MRLLDRYLLRELLIPLGYCLCGFLLVLTSADLFRRLGDFQRKNLTFQDIARYYLVTLPENVVLLLPIALLLALLYALTNHARHHEIAAIRAAGVSLWRLSWPYFAVGFIASVVVFGLNEFLVPGSEAATREIMARHQPPQPGALPRNQVRDLGFTNVRDSRTWQVAMYNEQTGEMFKPLVLWTQPDGSCLRIEAQRAVRTNGVWTFFNVFEHQDSAKTNTLPIPVLRTNVLAIPEFSETPEQIRSYLRIAPLLRMLPSQDSGKADVPVFAILNYLRLDPMPAQANLLYTKLQGRLAAPWTCLVVVLIAIPFGAASGRRNVYVGVASSLLICFVYYIMLLMGLALGTCGWPWLPPWLAAWFPNLSFGLAGVWMTARVR